MEWASLLSNPSVEGLERFASHHPSVLSPDDLGYVNQLLGHNPLALVCIECGADSSKILLDTSEAQNQCTQCGSVWGCSFVSQLEHPEIARAVCGAPWDQSTIHIQKTKVVPYHASDNFVRYLTARIKGWTFKCGKAEEKLICSALRRLDDPSLSQFRKILETHNLRKYYQRYRQFLALAFPERLEELLTVFESPLFRQLIQLHRGYVMAFEEIKEEIGCACFPNRGFTACYLMFRNRETWKYIQFMSLPKLRETAELNLRRLQSIEIHMVSTKRLQLTEVSPEFPLYLFYDSKRLKEVMPTQEDMEMTMRSFTKSDSN